MTVLCGDASGFLLQKMRKLLHKGIDILELAVDRGEADIGNLVERLEPLHDHLADLARRAFALEPVLQLLLDLVGNVLEIAESDGALFARLEHTVDKLVLVERLAAAVALDNNERQALHNLIRCEPALAGKAFPSPPNGRAFVRRTGVDDLAFRIAAKRASHTVSPLKDTKINILYHMSRAATRYVKKISTASIYCPLRHAMPGRYNGSGDSL